MHGSEGAGGPQGPARYPIKHYSALFKAQLVQKMLREEKTCAQLASDHEVHVNQLREWRRIAVEGLPSLFETRDATATLTVTHEQQMTDLYAEIGWLTTELTWLKKSCDDARA